MTGSHEARTTGAGPRRPAAERRCIASGRVRAKDELLRFVVGPDGGLVLDLTGRLPGRGLWLSARRDMLDKARDRNLFARAAKCAVRVPGDLAAEVERSLRRRCLDLVGLARRAGQAAAGFEKVRSLLAANDARLLIHAVEAAPDGRGKLDRLAAAAGQGVEILQPFGAEELGRALGRERVVHVVLRPGAIAERLAREAARLAAVTAEAGPRVRRSEDVSA